MLSVLMLETTMEQVIAMGDIQAAGRQAFEDVRVLQVEWLVDPPHRYPNLV